MSSDSDSDDPFVAKGAIKVAKKITADDVSSDDDCGTNAWLKSGKDKKEALKEKERLANLRTQSEGTKPSDALNVDDDEEVVDFSDQPSRGAGRAAITSEPSPKRARRGKGKVTDSPSGMASSAATGKASRSTAGASDVNLPDLDAQDRALLAKRDKQAKELEKLKGVFELPQDVDDEEDDTPAARNSGRQRGGGGAAPRGAGAAASSSGGGTGTGGGDRMRCKIWLRVFSLGAPGGEMMCVPGDQPLSTSGAVAEAAKRLNLDAARTQLYRAAGDAGGGAEGTPTGAGESLDLARTPRELGLVPNHSGPPMAVWAAEKAEATMKVMLRTAKSKESIPMEIAPSATFASLLERFCAMPQADGLTPAQLNLLFDGDPLDLQRTPEQAELEDEDIIEVTKR